MWGRLPPKAAHYGLPEYDEYTRDDRDSAGGIIDFLLHAAQARVNLAEVFQVVVKVLFQKVVDSLLFLEHIFLVGNDFAEESRDFV